MKRLTLLAIAFIVATLVPPARAQTIQTTWQQSVFSGAATSGPSAIVRNVNQSSHWLTYCVTGAPPSFSIWLEQSADGVTNWLPISAIGTKTGGCGLLTTGGYWFAVRANKTIVGGLSPTVTAIYTASTGTLGTPNDVGLGFQSQAVTYDSIKSPAIGNLAGPVVQVNSTATQFLPITGNYVLYGATVYNPNGVTVYVGFTNAPGIVPSSAPVMLAVPAGQSQMLTLPVQGVSFPVGLAINCSTAIGSNADPTSSCAVNPFVKAAFAGAPYNGVPN
jgi:hypothetical protein